MAPLIKAIRTQNWDILEDAAGNLEFRYGPAGTYPVHWIGVWGRPQYFDDFLGDAIRDEWNTATAGTGVAAAIVADGINGQIELSTGAFLGGTSTLDFGQDNYQSNYSPVFESYVYIDDVSQCTGYCGFYMAFNDYAYFRIAAGAIWLESDDAGVEGPYSEDSGQTVGDGEWVLLRVEVDNTETAVFWINGVVYGTPTAGAVTAVNMTPYFHITNGVNADVCKLFIDYVKIWQQRDT